MLISNRFCFIHYPKTGGTFVCEMLKRLLAPSRVGRLCHDVARKFRVRFPLYPYVYVELPKHTFRRSIPQQHRLKPIVACVRHPIDLYVSHYRFGWWHRFPESYFDNVQLLLKHYPSFPQLSFTEFAACVREHGLWSVRARDANMSPYDGWYSREFISCFASQPSHVLASGADYDSLLEAMRRETKSVRFLRMESLNQDLMQALSELGYDRTELSFIEDHGRIYPGKPTRSPGESWRQHCSREVADRILGSERLILDLFPEYGNGIADEEVSREPIDAPSCDVNQAGECVRDEGSVA